MGVSHCPGLFKNKPLHTVVPDEGFSDLYLSGDISFKISDVFAFLCTRLCPQVLPSAVGGISTASSFG